MDTGNSEMRFKGWGSRGWDRDRQSWGEMGNIGSRVNNKKFKKNGASPSSAISVLFLDLGVYYIGMFTF